MRLIPNANLWVFGGEHESTNTFVRYTTTQTIMFSETVHSIIWSLQQKKVPLLGGQLGSEGEEGRDKLR